MYPAYQRLQNKQTEIFLYKTKPRIKKEKELNILTGLAFAYALHGWLESSRENTPEEEIILAMAADIQKESEKMITTLFDYVTNTQKKKIEKILNCIAVVFDKNGEQFTVYINLVSSILEDVLAFEKLTPAMRQGIENLTDSVAGLLTQFDADYSDTESAEKATLAFNIWKRRKF